MRPPSAGEAGAICNLTVTPMSSLFMHGLLTIENWLGMGKALAMKQAGSWRGRAIGADGGSDIAWRVCASWRMSSPSRGAARLDGPARPAPPPADHCPGPGIRRSRRSRSRHHTGASRATRRRRHPRPFKIGPDMARPCPTMPGKFHRSTNSWPPPGSDSSTTRERLVSPGSARPPRQAAGTQSRLF